MTEYLYFISGIIIGIFFMFLKNKTKQTHGIIQVDEKKNLCRILVTSKELGNIRCKKVTFNVEHNIDIRDNNIDYNE